MSSTQHASTAPARSSINIDAIPAELRASPQWVNWKIQVRSGKSTKVPICPHTGRAAKVNEPSSWASFDVALAAFNGDPSLAGIGFVFTPDDPYCGVDLDGCIVDGVISTEAQSMITQLNSYAEISPSGTGVKIIIRGRKPSYAKCCQKRVSGMKQVEVYDQARFFVITSNRLPDSPVDVPERQQPLDALCVTLWPKASKSSVPRSEVVTSEDGAELPMAERVTRCRRYIEKLPDAISGQGGHNATLRAACECFRFGLDDANALELMRQFNTTKTGGEPWTESELQHKLNDAKRIVSSEGELGTRVQLTREHVLGDELERVVQLPTDMGNAARLVRRFGDRVRYCHASARWYVWDGRRWRLDERGAVVRHCKSTALSIYDEAKRATDDAIRAQLTDWAKASQKRERLTAMAALAQSEVAVSTEELDRDDWLLNCENGTIDLRTGELRPHCPEDLITKLAPVCYDPDARCPLFDACLSKTFAGNRDLITFLQRLLGHSLTGDVSEQYLFIFHGDGNNGKSLILDTISAVMGDYAAESPPDLITARKNPEHPTEIADLLGRRLVVASETERGAELRVQLIKRLTGNQYLKARYMKKDFFQFRRTHKLILVTNNKPVLRENTEAVWRRIRLVPFEVIIPKHERDPKLLHKLKAEYPGILAWLLRGCLDWQRLGLTEPVEVMHATATYRGESGGITDFLRECCELDEQYWCATATLQAQYQHWCRENHQLPLQASALGAALRAHQCLDQKRGGDRGWVGLRLRSFGKDGVDGLDSRVRLTAS